MTELIHFKQHAWLILTSGSLQTNLTVSYIFKVNILFTLQFFEPNQKLTAIHQTFMAMSQSQCTDNGPNKSLRGRFPALANGCTYQLSVLIGSYWQRLLWLARVNTYVGFTYMYISYQCKIIRSRMKCEKTSAWKQEKRAINTMLPWNKDPAAPKKFLDGHTLTLNLNWCRRASSVAFISIVTPQY